MIVGTGIDIVSVERFRKLYSRYGNRLIEKLFPEGIDYCFKKRKGEFYGCLSSRFALKEAVYKALSGCGLKVSIRDISILEGGKNLRVSVKGLPREFSLLYSISHEKEFAVAVVNVVKRQLPREPG
jgi:holo-[acyl-carrier protein] synthase